MVQSIDINENIYLIYLFTFPDGKYYVGITKNIIPRWNQHKTGKSATKIQKAIKYFKWENIKKEILASGLNKSLALDCEKSISDLLNTIDDGYNTLAGPLGGKNSGYYGHKHSEATKKHWSKKRRGPGHPLFGKAHPISGENHHESKKVIDLKSGIIFDSAKEAAYHYSIKYSTLKSSLNGSIKNKTSLRYVEDYE